MIYHHKKANLICFDPEDLRNIFEAPLRGWIKNEITQKGYSQEELLNNNKAKMFEVVERWKGLQNKEDIEIFSALYLFLKFFGEKSLICFPLKDEKKIDTENINSIEKLKRLLKENSLTDFGFMGDDGYRAFQLKQYRGNSDDKLLSEFIRKKLLHYGNNLGDTNLLIILQSAGALEENFFENVHENIKNIELRGKGNILISYNEGNKFDVINTVYPTLVTTRLKHEEFHQS